MLASGHCWMVSLGDRRPNRSKSHRQQIHPLVKNWNLFCHNLLLLQWEMDKSAAESNECDGSGWIWSKDQSARRQICSHYICQTHAAGWEDQPQCWDWWKNIFSAKLSESNEFFLTAFLSIPPGLGLNYPIFPNCNALQRCRSAQFCIVTTSCPQDCTAPA